MVTMTKIASEVAIHPMTLSQMVKRGVLPRGDLVAGHLAYYSEEAAAKVVSWLRTEYVRGVRYKGLQVQILDTNHKEVV